mmetsp:Transcript_44/g.69  ORF Transcript_44/g.69 Transcript_44/m.69 type:complete len:322 (-) Transcript_44:340-1305(-)
MLTLRRLRLRRRRVALQRLDVELDALEQVRLAVLEAPLLEEGAGERLAVLEVGGGHHGEEVVLRLQRDVAGEHVDDVATRDVARREGRLFDERHAVVAALQHLLAVVGREDDDARHEASAERAEQQVPHPALEELEEDGIVDGEEDPLVPHLLQRPRGEHLEALHPPIYVQYRERGHVVVLLLPLHPVERLGELGVVLHESEDGCGLHVGVVAKLVGHQVVRVVPRPPPLGGEALPPADGHPHEVVPVDELGVAALEDAVVKVVVRGPASEVEAETEQEGAQRRRAVVQQVRTPDSRRQGEKELEGLVRVVGLVQAHLLHR